MGCTIHVNGAANSLVHKGSNGFSMSTMPDVCKTPSPGGPVPIPYPVIISRSGDLSKGTKKVKVDGKKPAAVKGSQITRCNGDEPGTAGGVKSSTNMKEAKWLLYSFDVKMEGKNVCRLGDKMTMNHGNTLCLAGTVNPPVPLDTAQIGKTQQEACDKLEENKVTDHDQAAQDAGMLQEDYDAIRDVCHDQDAMVSFRDTNQACMDRLREGVPSKGPEISAHTQADGLVEGFDHLTGDYDMHDTITSSTGSRIRGGSSKEARLIERFNEAIPGDQPRVMHGSQANYGDYLRKNPDVTPKPKILQPDPPITAFDGKSKPADVYRLKNNEDIMNMYKCKGTEPPEEWNLVDAKTGESIRI